MRDRLLVSSLAALLAALPALGDEERGVDPLPGLTEFVREPRPDAGPEFDARYTAGVLALRDGRHEDAAVALARASLQSPTDPRPHALMTVALMGAGRFDLAGRAARRAFALYPRWRLEDFQLSRVLSADEGPAFAARVEPEIQRALSAAPTDPELGFLLSLLQHASGKRVTARENLQRLLREHPDHTPARQLLAAYGAADLSPTPWRTVGPGERPDDPLVRGYHLFWLGHYRRSAGAFAEAALVDPMAVEPRIELGHALFAAGRFALAGKILHQGLAGSNDPARRRLDLYQRFRRAEDLDQRRQSLEDYVRSHPSDYESLFLYAYTLFRSGHAVESLPLFDLLARTRSDDEIAAAFAAEARRIKDGGTEEAGGPEPDPRSGPGLLQSGIRTFKNGRYAESLRLFEEATRIERDEPHHHFWLSLSRFAVGQYSGAGLTFRQGMRHVQDWKTFEFSWADAYGNGSDFDEQVGSLARHSKANPTDADARLLYGVLLLARRDYAGAITAFEQNVQTDPGDTLSLELARRARDEARRGRY